MIKIILLSMLLMFSTIIFPLNSHAQPQEMPLPTYEQQMEELDRAFGVKQLTLYQYIQLKNELVWERKQVIMHLQNININERKMLWK